MNSEQLDLLVCPLGKAPLRWEDDAAVCSECGLRYPIEDGIPRMVVDDATLPDGVDAIEDLSCFRQAEGVAAR